MYRCSNCKKLSQPGEPMTHVVVQTREVTYPARPWANRYCEAKRTWPDDPGGKGTEVVREIGVCPRCAAAAAPAEGGVDLTGWLVEGDGRVNFASNQAMLSKFGEPN